MRKIITATFAAFAIAGASAGVAGAFPDGSHLVPSEFAPGVYKAVANDGTYGGYVEVCADWSCSFVYGVSDNAYMEPGTADYFVVSEQAVYVKTDGVDIYRVR